MSRSCLSPAPPDDLSATGSAAKPPASQRKPKRRKAVSAPDVDAEAGLASSQADDLSPGFDAANLRRCSGCGGMVYLWPCLACQRRRVA